MAAVFVFEGKKKVVQNGSIYCFVSYFPPLMFLFCFGITKTEMAAKTASVVPKLVYKGRRVPQLKKYARANIFRAKRDIFFRVSPPPPLKAFFWGGGGATRH